MSVPLPVRASVRDLLCDLLGRSVTVSDGRGQQLDPGRPAQAAAYQLDDGDVVAACVCDAALAASAGAAIGMVPPPEAAPTIEGDAPLDGDLEEFFHEVVNVLSKLLNSPTSPHLVLGDRYPVPGPVPPTVAPVLLEPGARLDYVVTIEGYGGGALTFLRAAG